MQSMNAVLFTFFLSSMRYSGCKLFGLEEYTGREGGLVRIGLDQFALVAERVDAVGQVIGAVSFDGIYEKLVGERMYAHAAVYQVIAVFSRFRQ